MREIKFRAWDKACECMVEDSWQLYLNGTVSVSDTWATKDIELMQFTGLTDRNGVEIYEGDIVKGVGSCDCQGQSNVFYGYGQWQPFSYLGTYNGSDFEVIGNIHQNPELLEAKGENIAGGE